MCRKSGKYPLVFGRPPWFLAYFNNTAVFLWFTRSLWLERNNSLSGLFVSFHVVYWYYSLCTAKRSPVLPLFSPVAEIFGIRNHFSERHMLPLLVWNGSSDIWSPFHLRYFRRIPAASSENFWKYITVYCLLPSNIFLYKDNPYSLHIRKQLLPIHSRSCFSAFW